MEKHTTYGKLAEHYDLIYSWKDYGKESKRIHDIIEKNKRSEGKRLLEVACGTGGHLRHLRKWYDVVGLDKSNEMLAIAQKKFPHTRFVRGDMIDFSIRGRFDAITSLFSSIAYVKTYNALREAIVNFHEHLVPGGVLIIEPFLEESEYRAGTVHLNVQERDGIKICRMNTSKKRGRVAVMDFHFLIGTHKGVEHVIDRHELGLFDHEKVVVIMREAGFKVIYHKRGLGRGLFIGVKK